MTVYIGVNPYTYHPLQKKKKPLREYLPVQQMFLAYLLHDTGRIIKG